MLDQDYGVSPIHEELHHLHQLVDIGEVQTGCGFVEDIKGFPRAAFAQLQGELHALGLASRERQGTLSQTDVIEANVTECVQSALDLRNRGKELLRLFYRHLQDLVDVFPLVANVQRLAGEPLAVADVTGDVDVGQEVHFDLDRTGALAVLAAAALDVEGEASGFVAARLGLREAGEQLTNRREEPDVGGGVGTRCAPDRALVDIDDLVDVFVPFQGIEIGFLYVTLAAAHAVAQRRVQNVGQEGTLAGSGNAGDHVHRADPELRCDLFEVVFTGTDHTQDLTVAVPAGFRDRYRFLSGEPRAGHAVGIGNDLVGRSLGNDRSPVNAGARSQIDDVIRREQGLFVVFYHQQGVPQVAQMEQRREQALIVPLMESDRRLVEDVEHADQLRTDLRRQPDSLRFAAGERGGGAVEGQVVQADALHEPEA